MHTHTVSNYIQSVKRYHHGMVRKATRPDLAAMLVRLARQTVAAEQPVLAAHGLSMWGYIVLTAVVVNRNLAHHALTLLRTVDDGSQSRGHRCAQTPMPARASGGQGPQGRPASVGPVRPGGRRGTTPILAG